jgi:predicted ATPase
MFLDVDVMPTSHGRHRLRFQDRWNESVWYTPDEVSDGTMLLTAYLLLQHQTPPLDIIAIEEPERGLHPHLLGELITHLRKVTTGEMGPRPVQIVLATHSAELLDHVRPEEVRFLSRDRSTGEVKVEEAPTGDERWREAYKTYEDSLGALWLSGGLGGVPGS